MKFTLTYGRVVILERDIEAESKAHAWVIAGQLEHDGELGLADCKAKPDSFICSIGDCDVIWDIEEALS